MAISIKAAELMQVFQWHDNLRADVYEDSTEIQNAVREELADIVIYSLRMAAKFDIDILSAVEQKLDKNEERYTKSEVENIRDSIEEWRQ